MDNSIDDHETFCFVSKHSKTVYGLVNDGTVNEGASYDYMICVGALIACGMEEVGYYLVVTHGFIVGGGRRYFLCIY